MDWQIGEFVSERKIGAGLAQDWLRIGQLASDWHWIGELAQDWQKMADWHQIGGLALDWAIGNGLGDWQRIG